MKQPFLLILFMMLVLISDFPSKSVYPDSRVQWQSFNEGWQAAKKKKTIVIFFFADWCHWCRAMDKDTFSNSQVISKISGGFVPVKINIESRDVINYKNKQFAPKEFAAMMGVEGLPNIVFMDKDGEIITRIPGFVKTDIFLPLLGYIKDECYKNKVPFRDYVQRKTDCKGK
jgi:thioredoxin-related protein